MNPFRPLDVREFHAKPGLIHVCNLILDHGNTVRFIRNGAVYAACPAVDREGNLFSELSPAITSLSQARDWLGY